MGTDVRVRFAPSPTGYMHVGNARTAIFNWLYARHTGGVFILRIEDTDRERSTEQAVQVILDGLKWLGVDWDEGPYYQSERFDLYKKAAERLLAEGKAYRCYCTPEELAQRREAAAKGKNTGYDGRCRDRTEPREGVSPTVRIRTPDEGKTVYEDLIQGRIEIPNEEIDDRIILRSDGTPTYNLSVVVDDHDMRVSHVIRGADHMSNTPIQVILYEALGYDVPLFAHQSLILGPDRAKLSKRHGSVKVTEYRESGILPEALFNGLLRLGWSHGDQELFEKQEMIDLFDLSDANRAPSIFDVEKLTNLFNHHYIRQAEPKRIVELLAPLLESRGADHNDERIPKLIEPLSERCRTLVEMADQTEVLLAKEVTFDPRAKKKHLRPVAAPLLRKLADYLSELPPDADGEAIMEKFHAAAEAAEVKLGKMAQPARVAMIGTDRSPGIDFVVGVVGLSTAVERMRAAAAEIESRTAQK